MATKRPRLKKGDITLNEMLILSKAVYGKEIDNKESRAKMDVQSAKITGRKNMQYNRSLKKWEQTGREVKITLIIKTKPESYKDTSGIKIHKYPVVFLLRDLDKDLDSPFRCRVGSLRKPKFPKKKISEGKNEAEKDKIRKENKKIQKNNILNGIQLQFFFDLMWVYHQYGLLYGPDFTNGPPKKRNPNYTPFFSKHEYFIVTKILTPLLKSKKGFIKERLFKNEDLEDIQKTPSVEKSIDIKSPPDDSDGLFF